MVSPVGCADALLCHAAERYGAVAGGVKGDARRRQVRGFLDSFRAA
jgi:hypothetical protein